MNSEFKKRLKSYSIAAGAVLSAGTAKSAIVYTDVNPDQTFSTTGGFYMLDLNNDNVSDFKISLSKFGYYSFSWASVAAQALNANEVASSGYYAMALAANAQVNAALAWNTSSYVTMAGRFRFTSYYSSFSSSFGNWMNVTDKYLGLKLKVGSNTYYGWARLDVNILTGTFTIKDYAYNNSNNQVIVTGVIPADPATSIVATDVGNNANGLDLGITFNKAANEATVSSYRLMIVKNSAASTFDVTAAQAVPLANYTAITPNGSNVSLTLTSTSKDVDGDPITLGVPYRAFVLSKADGVIRTNDGLSSQSNAVTLNTTAGGATSLVAIDTSENGNSADMFLSFNRAFNETGVFEYRVIILKSADAASFNLAAAKAVAFPNYVSITPTGTNIAQTLPTFTFDNNGLIVTQNQPYKYFVLSVSNNLKANIDTLSGPSNEVTLIKKFVGIDEDNYAGAEIYSGGQSIHINTGEFTGTSRLRLIDNSGRSVFHRDIEAGVSIINPSLTKGVYIAELFMNDKRLVRKVFLN